MDKKIAALLGAAAALTAVGGAQAAAPAQTELAPAASYRDLLQPVPNAVAALKSDDARAAEKAGRRNAAGRVIIITIIIAPTPPSPSSSPPPL